MFSKTLGIFLFNSFALVLILHQPHGCLQVWFKVNACSRELKKLVLKRDITTFFQDVYLFFLWFAMMFNDLDTRNMQVRSIIMMLFQYISLSIIMFIIYIYIYIYLWVLDYNSSFIKNKLLFCQEKNYLKKNMIRSREVCHFLLLFIFYFS